MHTIDMGVKCRLNSPENSSQSSVLAEWSIVLVSLLPELLAMLGIVWRVDGVVDANHHYQQPGKRYQNAVGIQRTSAVSFASSERVEVGHDCSISFQLKPSRCDRTKRESKVQRRDFSYSKIDRRDSPHGVIRPGPNKIRRFQEQEMMQMRSIPELVMTSIPLYLIGHRYTT